MRRMNVPLSNPDITCKEIEAVLDVLSTPNLSTGPKVQEFERAFSRYVGSKYAVAINSGTSGLHLCIKALGIQDGDEVLTTPFSFIASANCILFERARPVFVDIRENTLNIDENKIEGKITKRTKAILPVHVFGYPCDMAKINRIAKKYNLAIIEDACEAIGAEIGGKRVGTFSDCAVFAFYPNKQMTTGEGGMMVTDRNDIAALAKSMRNQGRDEGMGWLAHNRLGYNYRLSDINCALGIAQLRRIKRILKERAKVASLYKKNLEGLREIIIPPDNIKGISRSWFVYVIRLREFFTEEKRNWVVKQLKAKGIGCNIYFPPIHLQPFYKKQFGYKRGDFPVAEGISERTIALPFYNKLSAKEIKYIVDVLKSAIKEVN